jgi:anti-sigma regulatory factor (Ser/Thr protein kinase)
MSESIVLELTNDRAELVRLAEGVRSFGSAHGLSSDMLFAVDLALDELVTNVIRHGFPDGGAHVIRLRLDLADDELRMALEDDGIAFNPLVDAKAPDLTSSIDDRPVGGLGVHLARSLMDEITYERRGTRNVLRLRKRLI